MPRPVGVGMTAVSRERSRSVDTVVPAAWVPRRPCGAAVVPVAAAAARQSPQKRSQWTVAW